MVWKGIDLPFIPPKIVKEEPQKVRQHLRRLFVSDIACDDGECLHTHSMVWIE